MPSDDEVTVSTRLLSGRRTNSTVKSCTGWVVSLSAMTPVTTCLAETLRLPKQRSNSTRTRIFMDYQVIVVVDSLSMVMGMDISCPICLTVVVPW
ncbi:MAG: hypothetical protein BWY72_02054 [Bacteroidetes bacterium ADurb.Bin416]|nr:MAG: hypothetical protein BWY72_02054 [Bacteroidetes bacterium ADurb.Bin416]